MKVDCFFFIPEEVYIFIYISFLRQFFIRKKNILGCQIYNKESGFLTSSINLVFYFCTGLKKRP